MTPALRLLVKVVARLADDHPPVGDFSEEITSDSERARGVRCWWIHGKECPSYCEYACGAICVTAMFGPDGELLHVEHVECGTLVVDGDGMREEPVS